MPRCLRAWNHLLASMLLAWVAIVGAFTAMAESALEKRLITIDTAEARLQFQVEIADEESERSAGLMFRQTLAPDAGMLFLYPSPRAVSFWMKNTILPLDMIFISEEGTVLSIARDTTPFSETPIPSQGEVIAVLEINGGLSRQLGIEPGSKVDWPETAP